MRLSGLFRSTDINQGLEEYKDQNSYAVFDNDKIAIYDFDGNIIKNMDI